MTKTTTRFTFVAALLMMLCAGAFGCATPPNPSLDALRAEYDQAVQADTAEFAPLELHEAGKAVDRAATAWERRRDPEETNHLRYVASKRIEIAREAAATARARAEAERLTAERGEILLSARTREVGEALRKAEASRRDAEFARLEAERRSQEADEARAAAEKQRTEADQARRVAEDQRREAEAAREEAARLASEERKLREALAELEARPTDRGIVLTLGDVLFSFDRSELEPGARAALERLVEFLNEYPDRELIVEGHTDAIGSVAYNAALSGRRASAVEAFLVGRGISAERVVSTGLGKAYPVASNDTAEGRQRNRRVEVVILEPGQRAAQQVRGAPKNEDVSAGPR